MAIGFWTSGSAAKTVALKRGGSRIVAAASAAGIRPVSCGSELYGTGNSDATRLSDGSSRSSGVFMTRILDWATAFEYYGAPTQARANLSSTQASIHGAPSHREMSGSPSLAESARVCTSVNQQMRSIGARPLGFELEGWGASLRARRRARSSAKNAEHGIPGGSDERDPHGSEPMQAVFGLGFEEHSQRLTPILVGREDFVGFQFHGHPVRSRPNFSTWPAGPARRLRPLNSKPLHGPELIAAAARGNKTMASQHAAERLVRLGHRITGWQ